MFAITADQIRSRSSQDAAGQMVRTINANKQIHLSVQADRSAGDEIQMLTSDAKSALQAILVLSRTKQWSVGCGVGAVRTPLASSVHEATGPALLAARNAVLDAKKKSDSRFALRAEHNDETTLAAVDAEAFIDLLLQVRTRRSKEGWEIFDLLSAGHQQIEIAFQMKISPQAVSKRAKAANVRAELAAHESIVRSLERADREALGLVSSFTH